jgi:hypothetical protein
MIINALGANAKTMCATVQTCMDLWPTLRPRGADIAAKMLPQRRAAKRSVLPDTSLSQSDRKAYGLARSG